MENVCYETLLSNYDEKTKCVIVRYFSENLKKNIGRAMCLP